MIKVITKYTAEMHKEFINFLFFRGKHYRYKRLFFSVCGVILVALWAVFNFFVIPDNFFAIVLLAIGVLLLLGSNVIPVLMSKQNEKEASLIKHSVLDIVFGEDSISISSDKDGGDDAGKMRYDKLFQVYETKNIFYFFITKKHAFLVSKDDFVNGSPDDLRTLLHQKAPGTFVICK